jgi:hypothetical protein
MFDQAQFHGEVVNLKRLEVKNAFIRDDELARPMESGHSAREPVRDSHWATGRLGCTKVILSNSDSGNIRSIVHGCFGFLGSSSTWNLLILCQNTKNFGSEDIAIDPEHAISPSRRENVHRHFS